jgi:crotonobetainyl-CoA:carnitine CoA-transferase CaiB-like acyl-CoA transferase
VLGATDCPFFTGPDGETFVSPMSLVGSMSFPFYLAAMRRADLGDDPRFLTPELRLEHLDELHAIVQQWIWSFDDMASLDAQLDEAKIATGQLRELRELAAGEWAEQWSATREVPDRNGGTFTLAGLPWHFGANGDRTEPQVPARQGEHNHEVLRELGYDDAEIVALRTQEALVEPSRAHSAAPASIAPV